MIVVITNSKYSIEVLDTLTLGRLYEANDRDD